MFGVVNTLKRCGAMEEGHFLLSSGRHSDRYFQCARLLQYPAYAEEIFAPIIVRIRKAILAREFIFSAVAGPAIGGIIPAFEAARQLGLRAIFTERDDNGVMTLRRGFEVPKEENILLVEDVLTTAKSSKESIAALEANGAKVVAIACIVDRRTPDIKLDLPVFSACAISAATWDKEECPLCKQGIPIEKPGSRRMI
ncbi:MAG: orotate phosphoribosyltransferase [Spirochaetaceae bacterium]|jgi:orotate phosphoribosyltransferase|nr:orotate phosphoribosyltransferase [Spirochaetaceae bacterium]